LKPGQASSVMEVKGSDGKDHQKRRQNESKGNERGSEPARPDPAEIHRELSRQRPGTELGKGQAFEVILPGHPAPYLHQITLHVPRKRNRPAEAEGSQAQEISKKMRQRTGR